MDAKKFKKGLIKLLKEKNIYEKDSDDILIDELVYQLELNELAKQDVLARGIQINVRQQGEPFYNLNQSIAVINQCTKNIQSILNNLGITAKERSKLKLLDKKEEFNLNEFLNEN
jgi:hypothetical protein